jgi:hypothetical protein
MRERLTARVLVAALVATLVVAAGVVALSGQGSGPRPLPVLGAVAGSAEASSMADDARLMPWGGVRYEAVVDLPELGGEAHAWEMGAGVGEAEVRDLAAALGVGGEVEVTDWSWVVDDAERRLEVTRAAGSAWYLSEVFPDEPVEAPAREDIRFDSGEFEGCEVEPAAPEACDSDVLVEMPENLRPDDLPTESEARRIALDLLAAAGTDVAGAAVQVQDGFDAWYITVEPLVDGHPVAGLASSVAVGSRGLVRHASGWLADPVRRDAYPLITTAEALERLNDEGSGVVGTGRAMPEPAVEIDPSGPEEDQVRPLPADGDDDCPPESCTPAPVDPAEPLVVPVTGVRAGLLFVHVSEQQAWLVPAYLFEIDGGEGGEMPVIAVADDHLIEPAQEEPAEPDRPVEGPGAGGGTSGSPGVIDGSGPHQPVPAPEPSGEAPEYVGLTEVEAQQVAAEHGEVIRVVERDGERYMTTDDYRTDRVNLVLRDGRVTSAHRG